MYIRLIAQKILAIVLKQANRYIDNNSTQCFSYSNPEILIMLLRRSTYTHSILFLKNEYRNFSQAYNF